VTNTNEVKVLPLCPWIEARLRVGRAYILLRLWENMLLEVQDA